MPMTTPEYGRLALDDADAIASGMGVPLRPRAPNELEQYLDWRQTPPPSPPAQPPPGPPQTDPTGPFGRYQIAQNDDMSWLDQVPDDGSFAAHLATTIRNQTPIAAPLSPQEQARRDLQAAMPKLMPPPAPPPTKEQQQSFIDGIKARAAELQKSNPPPPPPSKEDTAKFIADTRARAAAAAQSQKPPPNPFDPNVPRPGLLETNVPGYNATPVQPQGNLLMPWWPTASNVSDWLTGPPGTPQATSDPAYVRRFQGAMPLPGVRLATQDEQFNALLNNAPWLARLLGK